jgi:NhaP-type Na+/H+ or K+/H+ antiporter
VVIFSIIVQGLTIRPMIRWAAPEIARPEQPRML